MEKVIAGRYSPKSTPLIGIVSRSDSLLQWSSTLLSALGFPLADILLRNPNEPEWGDGLAVCDIVATDVRAALELPKNIKTTVVRIVSDDFLRQARELMTAKKA